MDLGLQGKHAIVTGGSRGIGKAIARELAREGVDVAIVARNKGDLEATARELAAETNRRIVPLAADVTSKEQVDRMVAEAAQQLGGLHILVNSGSAPGGSTTATGPIETVSRSMHPTRHDPHRAHAEPARRPRRPAGRIPGRCGAAGLRSGLSARQCHLPHGGRLGDRVRRGIPGLG